MVGSTVLSATHAAGGAERNWSTHGNIFSQDRQSMAPAQLERYVRTFRNMRLRDDVLHRGKKAKKKSQPKEYPLNKGDWSSCDESEDELNIIWDTVNVTFTDFEASF